MKTPIKIVHDMIGKNKMVSREQFEEDTKRELFKRQTGREGKTCPLCEGTGRSDRPGRFRPLACDKCLGSGLV